ncbi:MAG: trypsin-like peptidase domain-containing protein [Planctomycetes bacterium]|nr:trypsin-like peptidase domain-containing protein [Planctomycetota bacterium]MCB9886798.1 trypsin-like peptidase domain-containing protein [Planctomycetota bacterium]
MSSTDRKWLPLLALSLMVAVMPAQDRAALVEDEVLQARIEAACERLRGAGKLVSCADLLKSAGEARAPLAFAEAAPKSPRREPEDVYDLVRKSARIVGHYYLCKECDDWHFSPSSGFCIDAGGLVATCAHVLPADEGMRTAYLVTADLAGNVWPVERVAAQDGWADVAVLATAERGGAALPLASSCRVGSRIYCLSNPDGQFGYFSEGLVARRYLWREPADPDGPDDGPRGPALPWLDVTCEFAKGSSGAPIVDATGALVGIAQATLTVIYDEEARVVDTQMVVHSAAPVESLRTLLRSGGSKPRVAAPK